MAPKWFDCNEIPYDQVTCVGILGYIILLFDFFCSLSLAHHFGFFKIQDVEG
jgi:hypothetical protein